MAEYPKVRFIEPEVDGAPGWFVVNDPTHKVVPVDALVIEAEDATAETVWVCEFGTVLSTADPDGNCEGCNGRQAVRGCGPRILFDPADYGYRFSSDGDWEVTSKEGEA